MDELKDKHFREYVQEAARILERNFSESDIQLIVEHYDLFPTDLFINLPAHLLKTKYIPQTAKMGMVEADSMFGKSSEEYLPYEGKKE